MPSGTWSGSAQPGKGTRVRIVGPAILVALLVGQVGAQDAGLSAWRADSLLLAEYSLPEPAGACAGQPHGPHRLPPRPGGSWLGLVFADGRPSRWDSLTTISGHYYWSLERACQAFGLGLRWDADLMRGELLEGDSLECGFVVGGEVLVCGEAALQMRAPVLYLSDRLLVPLDFPMLMSGRILSDRFEFQPDSLLLVQRPLQGPVATLASHQVGNRTYYTWPLPDCRQATFRTDGIGTISVDVPGVFLDPSAPPQPPPKGAGCLWALRPHAGGVTFVLRVDPAVRAWRLQWRDQTGELRLTLSTNVGDRRYRTYHPWEPPPPAPDAGPESPIVLALPEWSEWEDGGGAEPLRAVAQRLQGLLAALGRPVLTVSLTDQTDWAKRVNVHRPAVCICLLPDVAGERLLPGCRLVTAEYLPGRRPMVELHAPDEESGSASGADDIALRPWEGTCQAHAESSHRLASLMKLYLQAEFPGLVAAREHRAVAQLEGLDAPTALFYLGDMGAVETEDVLLPVPPLRERLAEALCGALRTFLRGNGHG